ncbi:MAG: metal/formaldehyde-sensitive transcriptional repressor [Candidatus Eisenbacteria bacterium]|nr:metal/formaldehyde-sensitive transcriptional repressor [Candidatus Eisenbacteria bacterium]MCC7142850.1 metal/formaldehyde-sensitive transcriptional repressor [Candidatus Eisenbacteria bacterium]
MAHLIRDKKKLLNRLARIKGQINAIERAIEQGEDSCEPVLQRIAACRGAMNGLMAQVIEGHVRSHLLDPHTKPTSHQAEAAQELLDVIHTYLK